LTKEIEHHHQTVCRRHGIALAVAVAMAGSPSQPDAALVTPMSRQASVDAAVPGVTAATRPMVAGSSCSKKARTFALLRPV
jgi:hypothetical protein